MKTEDFLERLNQVRLKGPGKWSALCPSHEDQSPSLSIHETDGKILLHCFAGCEVRSITAAVGVEMKDLFPNTNGLWSSKMEYVFSYGDEAGDLIFQVVRKELPNGRKTFKQQRPDGKGGFIQTTEGVRRVLYRLPAILQSRETPVVFHEGEKAVEAAVLAGLSGCHTTTAGGASAGKNSDFNPVKGREVVICPDNDQPGEGYLRDIAGMAVTAGAASVRVLRLPGLPAKGDVVEWLQAGGTPEQFTDLMAQAQPISAGDLVTVSVMSGPSSDVWPEIFPVKAELFPVPRLPLEIVPPAFRGLVKDVSERMQCPPDYVAAAMIVMVGSIIGAGCGIRPKKNDDWTVVPNLWGGVVGRPSMLKTPAIAEAMKPLEALEREAKLAYDSAQKQYEAEEEAFKARKDSLLASMRKVANGRDKAGLSMDGLKYDLTTLAEPSVPVWRRYKTNDATVEKMAELQAENQRGMLIFRDELIGLFATWDKDGHESDRAFFLEGFNGLNSYTADRIGRGHIHTPSNTVSLFGGIQPTKLSTYLYAAMRGHNNDGLVQRLQVLVYPDEPPTWKLVDTPINSFARQTAHHAVQRLATMDFRQHGAYGDEQERVPYYRFSEEGQQVFYQWWGELEAILRTQEDEPVVLEHLGKYRSLMPSLALIFHLLELASGSSPASSQVSAHHAKCAAAWCGYLEQHARRIYGLVTNVTQQAARRLASKLEQGCLCDGFTIRDVYRKDWSLLDDRALIEKACDELLALGWLREHVTPPAPGQRGKVAYLISPKVKRHA